MNRPMTLRMGRRRMESMGTFRYPIALGNPSGTEFEVLNALVDTGATYSFMPASLLERLELEPIRDMTFVIAGGGRIERTLGEARVRVAGRQATTIVVFGEEDAIPLLGAHALEGLGLAVDPVNRRLIEMEEAYLL